MATTTQLELDSYQVDGERATVFVMMTLDEINGALYHVVCDEEELNVYSDLGDALEYAEVVADDSDSDYDEEFGDGMSDAEADADTLASAGWGTDEDYGYYGED